MVLVKNDMQGALGFIVEGVVVFAYEGLKVRDALKQVCDNFVQGHL
jgi:hypothetical protein